ncbi:hypothetical protein NIES4075_23800 [Tolypothrix sp. NIES-4075]|nr:hypothetical protein NIES4075_23800 [Tolypothrix sp. NIES-4075]
MMRQYPSKARSENLALVAPSIVANQVRLVDPGPNLTPPQSCEVQFAVVQVNDRHYWFTVLRTLHEPFPAR